MTKPPSVVALSLQVRVICRVVALRLRVRVVGAAGAPVGAVPTDTVVDGVWAVRLMNSLPYPAVFWAITRY